jgi:hypothetical protein
MCKTRAIQIRCTPLQYELIQNKKEALGYVRLSDFVRDSILKEDLATYNLIREIHRIISNGDKNEKKIKSSIQR